VLPTTTIRSHIASIRINASRGSMEFMASSATSAMSSANASSASSEFRRSHCLTRGTKRCLLVEHRQVHAVRSTTCAKRAHEDGSNAANTGDDDTLGDKNGLYMHPTSAVGGNIDKLPCIRAPWTQGDAISTVECVEGTSFTSYWDPTSAIESFLPLKCII